MIKSPEKQYNAYRILKVLSNQDYLAVDYGHIYYVLSPAKSRYNSKLKSRTIQYQPNDQSSKILKIDHINYFVFSIGQHEVICGNNFDLKKIGSKENLFQLFAGSVNYILKHLLMKESNEARKYIDIRNSIIVKGHLYLLELDRGKLYPRSLQKSERLLIRSSENDSFRKILENQLRIIKYFGLFLWEIFFKSPYFPKQQQNEEAKQQWRFIKKMLKDMISKKITYEYLSIRIRQQEEKVGYSHTKKSKKINFLIRKETSRYQTQAMDSDKKYPFSRISTDSFRKNTSHCYTPLFERKRRMISEISTGKQAIQTFKSRLPKFKQQKTKWSNIYKSSGEDLSYRSSQSKMSSDVHEKLAKQSQIAKTMFKKFVEIRFNLRRDNNQQVNEGLRFKLMSKIQRFKTQHKSHSRQKQAERISLSHKNVISSSLQSYKPFEPVSKKLQFPNQKEFQPATSIIQNIPTPKEKKLVDTNAQQASQPLIKTVIANEVQKKNEEIQIYIEKQEKQIDESIQFQVINFAIINQMISPRIQTKTEENSIKHTKIQIVEENVQQNIKQEKQVINQPEKKDINYSEDKQKAITADESTKKKSKQDQFLKRRKLISQQKEGNQQIEVITIERATKQSNQVKKIIQPSIQPPTAITKAKSKKYDQIEASIEEFESLINILGDIATKSIRAKDKFVGIQWQRPIYFIYQRFMYERDKFLEALMLGVKQITRKHRIINEQQWDKWLGSNHRQQLIAKIEEQNKLLKEIFHHFSVNVTNQCKFQRKIDYYIRNRQKIKNTAQIKTRQLLSQFGAKYVIEVYNTIIQKRINNKQIYNFMLDCLFGSLIIGELNGLLEDSQKVSISNYQKYSHDLKAIDPIVDLLYSLYFSEQNSQEYN